MNVGRNISLSIVRVFFLRCARGSKSTIAASPASGYCNNLVVNTRALGSLRRHQQQQHQAIHSSTHHPLLPAQATETVMLSRSRRVGGVANTSASRGRVDHARSHRLATHRRRGDRPALGIPPGGGLAALETFGGLQADAVTSGRGGGGGGGLASPSERPRPPIPLEGAGQVGQARQAAAATPWAVLYILREGAAISSNLQLSSAGLKRAF
jgi:hypothetical protein